MVSRLSEDWMQLRVNRRVGQPAFRRFAMAENQSNFGHRGHAGFVQRDEDDFGLLDVAGGLIPF